MKTTIKALLTSIALIFSSLILTSNATAQNIGINTTGAEPDPSALLDLSSEDKGFLITRVDTAKITKPTFGLMTLSPLDSCLYMFNGKPKGRNWISLGGVGINCIEFPCGSKFTDERDNQEYGTVKIGSQCWMSENLNYKPSSGDSWCYDNDPAKCELYGRLYDWYTATGDVSSATNPSGVQGACPSGWHVPSDAEWIQLEIAVGMPENVANQSGWRGTTEGDALKTINPEWGGTNTSGFSAQPGGAYDLSWFAGEGTRARLWTSTENEEDISKAWRRRIDANPNLDRNTTPKKRAKSVRCLKD